MIEAYDRRGAGTRRRWPRWRAKLDEGQARRRWFDAFTGMNFGPQHAFTLPARTWSMIDHLDAEIAVAARPRSREHVSSRSRPPGGSSADGSTGPSGGAGGRRRRAAGGRSGWSQIPGVSMKHRDQAIDRRDRPGYEPVSRQPGHLVWQGITGSRSHRTVRAAHPAPGKKGQGNSLSPARLGHRPATAAAPAPTASWASATTGSSQPPRRRAGEESQLIAVGQVHLDHRLAPAQRPRRPVLRPGHRTTTPRITDTYTARPAATNASSKPSATTSSSPPARPPDTHHSAANRPAPPPAPGPVSAAGPARRAPVRQSPLSQLRWLFLGQWSWCMASGNGWC